MKYFSFVGKANIARVHVHDPEIAIAETKIDGIARETEIGTAIGTEIAIATATVGADPDRAKDEIGKEIVTVIGTGTGETEIGIETEGGRDR